MTNRLSISLLLCTAMLIGVEARAFASPPAIGHWVGDKPITLCDTKEQIDALVLAGKEKGNGFQTAYDVLYSTLNQYGEHTCEVEPPGTGNVVSVGEPAVMWFGDTQANVITAQLQGSNQRSYWLLYNTGNITQATPSSSPPPANGRDARGDYIRYTIPEPVPWWRELLGI